MPQTPVSDACQAASVRTTRGDAVRRLRNHVQICCPSPLLRANKLAGKKRNPPTKPQETSAWVVSHHSLLAWLRRLLSILKLSVTVSGGVNLYISRCIFLVPSIQPNIPRSPIHHPAIVFPQTSQLSLSNFVNTSSHWSNSSFQFFPTELRGKLLSRTDLSTVAEAK